MAPFDHDRVIGHTLKHASPAGTVITEEPLIETAVEPGGGRDAPARARARRRGTPWRLRVCHLATSRCGQLANPQRVRAGRDAAGPDPA
jgi:hypothetical protein